MRDSIELVATARPMRLSKIMTFNKLERLKPGHRWRINKDIKEMSERCWEDVDPITERGLIYSINAVVHTDSRPDPDSLNWVGKRMLDGAIAAGVIPDDSGTYISGTMTGAAKHIRSLPSGIVLFQGFYTFPDELVDLLFSV